MQTQSITQLFAKEDRFKRCLFYMSNAALNMNPGVGCIVVTVPQLTDVHSLKLKTTETQYASVTLLIINSCQSAPEFIYNIIYLCRLFLAEFWIWFCLSSCRRIQSHQITFNNRRLSLQPNQTWRQPKSNGFLNIDQRLVYFLHQTHCDWIRWGFFLFFFTWCDYVADGLFDYFTSIHPHTLIYREYCLNWSLKTNLHSITATDKWGHWGWKLDYSI